MLSSRPFPDIAKHNTKSELEKLTHWLEVNDELYAKQIKGLQVLRDKGHALLLEARDKMKNLKEER